MAWSVVYLLLLLSFATHFSFITIFVLLLPGVILYATLSVRAFAFHIAIVWIAAALLLSNPVIILLAVFFMVPALVMGHLYKTRASALKVVVMGTGTLLLEFLLAFLAVTVIYDFNLASSIEETLNTMMSLMQNMADNELIASDLVWSPEMAQQLSSLAARMTPFTMIMCSFLLAAVTHLIARPTLNSLGHSVKLPAAARLETAESADLVLPGYGIDHAIWQRRCHGQLRRDGAAEFVAAAQFLVYDSGSQLFLLLGLSEEVESGDSGVADHSDVIYSASENCGNPGYRYAAA